MLYEGSPERRAGLTTTTRSLKVAKDSARSTWAGRATQNRQSGEARGERHSKDVILVFCAGLFLAYCLTAARQRV